MGADYFLLVMLPNFFWKRSTRPSLSTNFCLPVKKGWQLEQISKWSSLTLALVLNEFPQAQVTVHSTYSGWISFFTGIFSWN
jgi:hypothetical protein